MQDEIYLTDPPPSPLVCDCCKRSVDFVRGSLWHGQDRICLECFYEWYDPSDPSTTDDNASNKNRIGNWVRKKFGLPELEKNDA